MDVESPQRPPVSCPSCGLPVDASAMYCPTCGRPQVRPDVAAATVASVPISVGATRPASTGDTTTVEEITLPPAPVAANPYGVSGIANLAAGPTLARTTTVTSHGRRNLLATLSAVLLVALLAGGAYWAYNVLAARTDTEAAKFVPANTWMFSSIDLLAASNNKYSFDLNQFTQVNAQSGQGLAGLDFAKDVQPWLGRTVTAAMFMSGGTSGTSATRSPIAGQIGMVALVQSRDDGASRAAVTKAVANQRANGQTINQTSYGGFALYEVSSAGGTLSAIAAGKNWVVIASDTAAAKAVIDRINGSGDSLATNQAFQDATANLPSGRFGTFYVNVRDLLSSVVPVRAPNGLGGISVPFTETYPVAGGYAEWTDYGMRTQTIFNAVRNPGVGNLGGDTTSLARLVPASAVGYIGVANLGALSSTAMKQSIPPGLGGAGDPLQSLIGVASTDPALQHPAAVAFLRAAPSTLSGQPLILLQASSSQAQALLDRVAKNQRWQQKPVTVGGVAATALYESYNDVTPPTPATSGKTDVTRAERLIGIAVYVRDALVIAPDTETASQVVTLAQQSGASLAQATKFQQLMRTAPAGGALQVYVDPTALASSPGAASAAWQRIDAIAATLVWNDSRVEFTTDVAMRQ